MHEVFPDSIDTYMVKDEDMPKTSAQVTAENIVAGIVAGQEYIFPDPMSSQIGELWAKDAKALECQIVAM